MINNKFVYHPEDSWVHVIDIGAETTYCDIKKNKIGAKGRDRRYTLTFPEDLGFTLCPTCHRENKERHFEVHLKPEKTVPEKTVLCFQGEEYEMK